MTVYVDNMHAKFGRMIMCHMIADTTLELYEMADMIGVARKWIQDAGTTREHFDIALTKKAKAISHGAKLIDAKELGRILHERNKAGGN